MPKRKSSPQSLDSRLSSDSGYKLLFSVPEMVRDLLIGYVPGKWLKDVDFSTLVHVSGSYVSESGKQRHDDRVWRVNIGGRWLWVYIVLEFQSGQPDQWMPLRIMEYVNQLALQIVREKKKHELPEGRLPPILPIVLYNGLQEWNVATDVADCFIKPPGGLEAFQPRLQYLLCLSYPLFQPRYRPKGLSHRLRAYKESLIGPISNSFVKLKIPYRSPASLSLSVVFQRAKTAVICFFSFF